MSTNGRYPHAVSAERDATEAATEGPLEIADASSEADATPGADVVSDPRSRSVRAFADHWLSKCVNERLPSRRDIDIAELGPWLGRVLMMDVIDGGEDFRYRLIGTEIVDAVGRDLTGRLVSDVDYSGNRDGVLDTFRRPLLVRGPVFRRGTMIWRVDRSWRHYESVHCPLAGDGETMDMTIGVQVYFSP